MDMDYRPKLRTVDMLSAYAVAAARQEACGQQELTVSVKRIDSLKYENTDGVALPASHKSIVSYLSSEEVRSRAVYLSFTADMAAERVLVVAPDGIAGKSGAFLDLSVFDTRGEKPDDEPVVYYMNEFGEANFGGTFCFGCYWYLAPYQSNGVCWACFPSATTRNPMVEGLERQIVDLNGPDPLVDFDRILEGEETRFKVPALSVSEISG